MQQTPPSPPLVILNPVANHGHMAHIRDAVQRAIRDSGATYHETTRAGDATELARLAADQGRPVVMIGGDGTVNEVAAGILQSGKQVPMGIIAAGSGNDFAWNTARLPRKLDEAIKIALYGRPQAFDAGIANEHYFVNAFSLGLDGEISAAATSLKRYPFMTGMILYYTSTLNQLLFHYRRCPWLSVLVDGKPLPGMDGNQRYVLLAMSNGPTYGAGFRIAPKAVPDDGEFEICAARHTPWLRAVQLLPLVQKGKHLGEREIIYQRGKHVTISVHTPIYAQMDGEVVREDRYDIRILPGALLVRVP